MSIYNQPYPVLEGKRLVIAGAGISGLASAITLHKLWYGVSYQSPPRLTIYERDPCTVPPNRKSYTLSIHSYPTAGIFLLQEMDMLGRLLSVASSGGDVEELEALGRGFEISWEKMRRTLVLAVEALPGVEIQWGNSVTEVAATDDDRIEIRTSKGEKVTADILISTDGSVQNQQLAALDNKVISWSDANHISPPVTGNEPNIAIMDGFYCAEQLIVSASVEEALQRLSK